MILGEVLNSLAQKAGIKSDSEELKSLLASPEMATIEVSDTIVNAMDSGLLSIDAAKNNHPDIKKKYFADAYDGMDKQLIALLDAETFDESDIQEIKAERSTSKKAELIVSKLKEKKTNAKGADKEEINKQLKDAHEAARLAKVEKDNVVKEYEEKIKNIRKDQSLRSLFAQYKTIYDELGEDIKNTSLQAIINKNLQDKNAELSFDENGNMLLVSKDGSNVFGSNHVQLTPQSFFDQTFAPILKVSGPPKPAAQPQGQTPQVTPGADANVSSIKSHTDKVLQDMSASKVRMV